MSVQNLSGFFKTIFNDNVETLASLYNSLQSENKAKITRYLREHNQDEAKIDELIMLSDERDGEDALFVRMLIKGVFQNFGRVSLRGIIQYTRHGLEEHMRTISHAFTLTGYKQNI
jgi:hypothetical protein